MRPDETLTFLVLAVCVVVIVTLFGSLGWENWLDQRDIKARRKAAMRAHPSSANYVAECLLCGERIIREQQLEAWQTYARHYARNHQ